MAMMLCSVHMQGTTRQCTMFMSSGELDPTRPMADGWALVHETEIHVLSQMSVHSLLLMHEQDVVC